MEKTLSSTHHTFENLVELFKQGKFTEVLRVAQPMIDKNPNEINLRSKNANNNALRAIFPK